MLSSLFLTDSTTHKFVWAAGELVDARTLRQRKEGKGEEEVSEEGDVHSSNSDSINSMRIEEESLSVGGLWRICRNYFAFLFTTFTNPAISFLVFIEFISALVSPLHF